MTFSLLIVAIILSVVGALVTLILGIVHLSGGRSRSGIILGVSFLMSLIIMVLCIMELVKRGSSKIKQGVEWLKEHDASRYDHSDRSDVNPWYAFVPDNVKDSVSKDFYNSSGENDNEECYIPLVYPYRFHSLSTLLMTHVSIERFGSDVQDSSVNELTCITHFTFDDKMLLAKRDNQEMMRMGGDKKSDLPDYTYLLFDFSSGKCRSFMNEDRMMEAAQEKGFSGSTYLDSDYTHYWNYSGRGE